MAMFHLAHLLVGLVSLLGLVIVPALMQAPTAEATDLSAPGCNKIITELTPCISFVRKGGSSNPSSSCCTGVKDLSGFAKTKSDRVAICNCVKKVLPAVGNLYDPSRLPLLPKKCGASIVFPPLNSKTDCSKV